MFGVDYKGCKIVKRERVYAVYAHNGKGWVLIFKNYTVRSVDDAKTLIDHHLTKLVLDG